MDIDSEVKVKDDKDKEQYENTEEKALYEHIIQLEESLSKHKKHQRNINVIQLVVCGFCVLLSTIR